MNGSGWRFDDSGNEFQGVEKFTGENPKCIDDCSKCHLCKTDKGMTIEVEVSGLKPTVTFDQAGQIAEFKRRSALILAQRNH
jgi:hypothetical protein